MWLLRQAIVFGVKTWHSFPVLVVVLVLHSANADVYRPFDGDWRGEISKPNRTQKVPVRIVIRGEKFTQYFCSDKSWKSIKGRKKNWFDSLKNQAVAAWIHEGGVWTETHMYSFSLVDENTLDLTWVRHVNNERPDRFNSTWHVFRHGVLWRSNENAEVCG